MDRINELVHTLVNTAVDDGAIMAVPIAAEVVREFKALESKLLSAEEERERLRTALIEKERECEDLKVDYEYTCELLAGERSRLHSVQKTLLNLAEHGERSADGNIVHVQISRELLQQMADEVIPGKEQNYWAPASESDRFVTGSGNPADSPSGVVERRGNKCGCCDRDAVTERGYCDEHEPDPEPISQPSE